jgi:hypothetical protein
MTGLPSVQSATQVVEDLLKAELRDIAQASADDRADHKLRQLRQRGSQQHLVEEEYAGRYPFELLQNAHDAGASSGELISARFDVTASALIISNMGKAFGPDEVQAICDLGASSKDPAKHVGYKGLGFKSVAEITDRPQVWSQDVAFEFDADRAHRSVERVLGKPAPKASLPVYAFPYLCSPDDAGDDADLLSELRREGFTTSIRLPFRTRQDRARVVEDVGRLIGPRLLLFLSSLEELAVVGAGEHDFNAIIETEPAGRDLRRVSLVWGDEFEQWLVSDRTVAIPNEIRTGFEDAWKRVAEVRVGCGIRVDEQSEAPFPLHVYFPTEVSMPFLALTHGDFMVGLDRRHLKKTQGATAYNEWLAGQLGVLMADMCEVVSSITGDATGLAAVAPRSAASGITEDVLRSLSNALLAKSIVPVLEGGHVEPERARMLPAGLAARQAFETLPLTSQAEWLATAEVHDDEDLVEYLDGDLGVSRLQDRVLAREFGEVEDDRVVDAYELLAGWVRRRPRVKDLAADVAYVLTTAGTRRSPTEVFFPPQVALRGEWDPDQVELVAVPSGAEESVTASLSLLGVEAFNRQKIIEHQILPPLLDPDQDAETRARCHRALREYLADGLGDKALRGRLGQVLVLTNSGTASDETVLRRADETYFSGAWVADGVLLERIYGPFGEAEFLAESAPVDPDERTSEIEYLTTLGVRREPRPLVAETTTHNQYKLPHTWQHPHRKLEPKLFDAWLKDPRVRRSLDCPLGHSDSQQIKRSVVVDRLPQLVRHGNRDQRVALLALLSRHWSEAYRSVAQATFHCQIKGSHGAVARDRSAPSLFLWLLRSEPWIPASVNDDPLDARPEDVWLLDEAGATQGAQLLLPTVDEWGIDPVDLRVVGRDLRLIAPETISVEAATAQLRRLARRYEGQMLPNDGSTRPLRGVSRWMLNHLRAAARRENISPELSDVPLLCQHEDGLRFEISGYASSDSTLRNRWRSRVPVLLADDAVHSWVTSCGWADLEENIRVEPRPHNRDPEATASFERALQQLYPFIAAVATDGATSRETTALPRLRALKTVVCEELWLDERIGEKNIDPARVGVYLKARNERDGSVTRRTGTLYVEAMSLDENIELGAQLASYLELPRGEGAALSLILQGEETAQRLLKSRAIPDLFVNDLAAKLGAPQPDVAILVGAPVDEPSKLPPIPPVGGGEDQTSPDKTMGPDETPSAQTGQGDKAGGPGGGGSTDDGDALPPLNPDAIKAFEVSSDVVVEIPTRRTSTKPSKPGGAGGRRTPNERLAHARSVVAIGDRGEEAAFLFECRRLEDSGRDPDEALWDAERNEWSPFDLTSIDEDGQLVYIEVKSTSDADPSKPFQISARQLEYASRYRGSYWIYRVVNTRSASPTVYRYRDPLGQGNFVGDSAMMRLPDHPDRAGG